MNWYAIYTKFRQEQRAYENLVRQEFECYLPTVSVQKMVRKQVVIAHEPLFPRYLFIYLDPDGGDKGWGAIRSTRGVTRLVTFGRKAVCVDERFIAAVRMKERIAQPLLLYQEGERVRVTSGPFEGIDGIFQMRDGEARAVVLVELLQKSARLRVFLKDIVKSDS